MIETYLHITIEYDSKAFVLHYYRGKYNWKRVYNISGLHTKVRSFGYSRGCILGVRAPLFIASEINFSICLRILTSGEPWKSEMLRGAEPTLALPYITVPSTFTFKIFAFILTNFGRPNKGQQYSVLVEIGRNIVEVIIKEWVLGIHDDAVGSLLTSQCLILRRQAWYQFTDNTPE